MLVGAAHKTKESREILLSMQRNPHWQGCIPEWGPDKLNGVLTKGSPIFKYIESSPCTGIHKQWEMHENGLALPLLAAVILVTAQVSSPSHRDGSLRRGGGSDLGSQIAI